MVIIGILIIVTTYFILFYVFQKRLFKILCASINEYLGNQLDYYFQGKEKPSIYNGDKKESRITDTGNHDDIEDIF